MFHDLRNKRVSYQVVLLGAVTGLLGILLGKLIVNDGERDPIFYTYGILVTGAISLLIIIRYAFYVDPWEVATKRLLKRPRHKEKQPLVTMMVAAFNEESFIITCIESLRAQTYTNREIIVVNDASTDRTREILDHYHDEPGLHVVNLEENVGKKKALAAAILEANGSVFVFTDSDSVLAPNAVARAVSILITHPKVGALSGHTRVYNANQNLLTRIQDTWYEGQFSIRKAYESVFGAVTCVSGPLAVFRREAVFNLIPAWINDTFLGSEFKFATDRTKTALVLANTILAPRIAAEYPDSPFITREQHRPRNWQVVYSRSVFAMTNVPDNLRSFIKQQVRWKKSFLRNVWLTGSYYWRKPFPAALMYYLRALFVFVGPFIVFRHLIWLPLNGDTYTAMLYLSGILFIGFTFATLHKIERPEDENWVYRPLMNFISTFMLSWLIFYSLLTIKKMVWSRG